MVLRYIYLPQIEYQGSTAENRNINIYVLHPEYEKKTYFMQSKQIFSLNATNWHKNKAGQVKVVISKVGSCLRLLAAGKSQPALCLLCLCSDPQKLCYLLLQEKGMAAWGGIYCCSYITVVYLRSSSCYLKKTQFAGITETL